VERADGRHLWVSGKKFIELLREMGIPSGAKDVRRLREEYGIPVKRTSEGRYTLIPYSLLSEEALNCILSSLLEKTAEFIRSEDVRVEIASCEREEFEKEEDVILGRKAYLCPSGDGFVVIFSGRKKSFTEPLSAREWILSMKEEIIL